MIEPSPENLQKEWLLTNGLGGYASSTILNLHTRKYHGLLVATLGSPWSRRLLLSKLWIEADTSLGSFHLDSNFFPGCIHPQGYEYLKEFRLDPFPTFVYEAPGIQLEQVICMPHGMNAIVVGLRVLSRTGAKLRVYPLVNCRSIHSLTKMGDLTFEQERIEGGVHLKAKPENISIYLGSDQAVYVPSTLEERERWYLNMEYPEERHRGYGYREDHYCPGFFEVETKLANLYLIGSGGWQGREAYFELLQNPATALSKERRRWRALVSVRAELYPLTAIADSFIVRGSTGTYVVAGYHWFSVWMRDTFISLPGLTLVLGRFEDAKDVLLTSLSHLRNGVFPNFIEEGRPEFSAGDVGLWFIYALCKYMSYTNDGELLHLVRPHLREIVTAYVLGKGPAKMDEDGLLTSLPGSTWMDARVEGKAVTPRGGKPVELNALWYNAISFLEKIGERVPISSSELERRFLAEFWDGERGYLCDVAGSGTKDWSLRPNQLFALSLPFPVIRRREIAERILERVRNELLTPFGLRTLSPREPGYRGVYRGDVYERDMAYHQGTAWPWLLGHFITASIRFGKSPSDMVALLKPFMSKHLNQAGLGTISELFDGDPPHTPGGCISQAWGVAEILRSYMEDVLGIRPPYETEYSAGV